jgi:Na+-transporting methylmalonyl-CoA/oxaloacetate decarboxylase gamma subunit
MREVTIGMGIFFAGIYVLGVFVYLFWSMGEGIRRAEKALDDEWRKFRPGKEDHAYMQQVRRHEGDGRDAP